MNNCKSVLLVIKASVVLSLLCLAACGGGGSNGAVGGLTTYQIGGAISGLNSGASVVLLDNGTNALTVSANGAFTFTTSLATGAAYAVTVGTQPSGETCAVSSGSGTVASANIASITVSCSTTAPLTYTIGGMVSGLNTGASGVLLNNGANALTVSANGAFTFTTSLADGAVYAVTVGTQPSGETCTVNASSGTIAAANVNNVSVNCATLVAPSTWTWESGSNVGGAAGTYGAKGVASGSNTPGAREAANSWTDSAGNLWLFGGNPNGFLALGSGSSLNDLWEYDTHTGNWTWMSGANTINDIGVYGTQGTASTNNVPGARGNAASWTDSAGNFWLFGGYGQDSKLADLPGGQLNDLWKYNPTAGAWTWVSGSNVILAAGTYGTKGVASLSNAPGARAFASTWTDTSGNLWLFGGRGIDSAGVIADGFRVLNDLWVYSPSTSTWTWVSGSNIGNALATYGTQGTASTSNVPGSRQQAMSWTDTAGNLWLFGGYGIDANGNVGPLSDLWKFNPSAGTWMWVNGSNARNTIGVYGTKGTPSSNNFPGAHYAGNAWTDPAGNLWMFGGFGYDPSNSASYLNDIWEFTPSTGVWTWVGGSNMINAVGSYGTRGAASASNMPGARFAGSSWTDSVGNVWLFGGQGFDSTGVGTASLNDLWKFAQ